MRKGWQNGMDLLIDTNVILNMVFKRTGCENAVQLFQTVEEKNNNAFITASTVTDLFYIIRRELHDTNKTYELMGNIFKLVRVLSVTEEDIQYAFDQKWKDFEDSSVPVVSTKECIKLM